MVLLSPPPRPDGVFGGLIGVGHRLEEEEEEEEESSQSGGAPISDFGRTERFLRTGRGVVESEEENC